MALFEADGTTDVILAADDVVRLKIGRGSGTPTLDISSVPDEILDGGSRITFTAGTNDCVVRIAQDDTADMETGAYDAEIAVVDNSETVPADAIKHAEFGLVFIHPTMGGAVGEEQSSSSSESS